MDTYQEQVIDVGLSISAEEYLLMYKGVARNVLATAYDGRRVRFPAKILQPFVTRQGIQGRFSIRFSEDGRFLGIEKRA